VLQPCHAHGVHVPEALGSLPRCPPTACAPYCLPASGAPYVPPTVASQVLAEAVQQALRERAPNCPHRVAHLLLNASYAPTVAASSTGAPALSSERARVLCE
jgi:hypothetical protein